MANNTEYIAEYNKAVYTNVGIYCKTDLWQEFKACCKANGVSMASVIVKIMEECGEK